MCNGNGKQIGWDRLRHVEEVYAEDARARREAARAAVRDNAIEVREDFESLAERANSTTEEDYGTDR